jgi:hypothetical protein
VIFFLAFVIMHRFFHSFVFCMQLVSKVFFFTRRIYALASLVRQIFLLVRKVLLYSVVA